MPLATLVLTIAFIWMLLKGQTSAGDLFVGLIFGLLIVAFLRKTYHQEKAFHRGGNIIRFALSFLWEIVVANIQVMKIVLSPKLNIRPGLLAYRTRCKKPLSVTLLANSITLTPGTLSVDISEDASTIFVHTLDIEHPDEVRNSIRRGLEDPLVRAME
jgi:multicomponent Na+:H+ antiporter subunit E